MTETCKGTLKASHFFGPKGGNGDCDSTRRISRTSVASTTLTTTSGTRFAMWMQLPKEELESDGARRKGSQVLSAGTSAIYTT